MVREGETQLRAALAVFSTDDREDRSIWFAVGAGLHKLEAADPKWRGREKWDDWSRPSDKFNKKEKQEKVWASFDRGYKGKPIGPGTIFHLAMERGYAPPANEPGGAPRAAVQLEDFVAFMRSHDYIYMPSGDFWPAARVDARLPPVPLLDRSGAPIRNKKGEQKEVRATAWLAKHAPVEQMTWAPGLPQLIRDRLISDGGWIDRKGATVFNLYRPPTLTLGDAAKAGPMG